MPAGRPTKYKPEFCDVVIEAGREGKTLAEMASELDVNRATVTAWVAEHPEFSSAINSGLDHAQAWWENNGRLATFGGFPGYNATSYIFQMKNRFKEDWRDRQEIDNKHDLSDPMAEMFAQIASQGRRIGKSDD